MFTNNHTVSLLLSLLFMLMILTALPAQEYIPDSTLFEIETMDGNTYYGKILNRDTLKIVLQTHNLGNITIQNQNIKRIREVSYSRNAKGLMWFESPVDSRYFFQANAYGVRKGQGYYQNTWILYNQVSFGVSNNVTIGGGIIPLFLIAGAPTPVYITPKVSFPLIKDKLAMSIGGLFGAVIGQDGGGLGIAYGNLTIGSRDENINFGVGFGYAGSDWGATPTFSLSGLKRVSPKLAVLTENYVIGDGVLSLLGCRFIGKKIAVDGALVIPIFEGLGISFIAIPWLGITVPFSNKKQLSMKLDNSGRF